MDCTKFKYLKEIVKKKMFQTYTTPLNCVEKWPKWTF